MSELAIRAEGLGKKYRIGAVNWNRTLRDSLQELLESPWRRRGSEPPGASVLWALRDVALEVRRGEVLGVIGRNGSGKSTLLKVLSRITRPTTGHAEVHGRAASLLEVGTGFHNELTGRDNVFLSGAILGMRRTEIVRKFDEIVSFAGVERFIDTPVKHFSSGMYLRLAFAVAAHLETEILILDEVLAVGDLDFQKKCLGRMEELAHSGRTILFVSHNIDAVSRLCPVTLLLDAGRVSFLGETSRAVQKYLSLEAPDGTPRTLDST